MKKKKKLWSTPSEALTLLACPTVFLALTFPD